uniref:uncharacterized protein LOC122602250 n=1 Tax=Erigeron canadensis TaxID=72917 RepID=UPI001CB9AD2B|nr:uncharacterized protein LOC122602250 [Erigeron canadensis]
MSFLSTFVAYLKHVIRGGAGAGGEVPTMTTTITIGNRWSRPLFIQYGSPPTKPEFVLQTWSDFRSWAMNNAGFGSSASMSIISRRARIVHSVDTSTIIMNSSPSNPAAKRLLDAFHLMETDASIRKVVISLSTDYHVWNSIVRNKAFQELCISKPGTANEEAALSYMEEGESASQIIKWLFSNMASGITEFMGKIDGCVSGVLQWLPKSNNTMLPLDDGVLEERVRSPMLLSIVLLMVYFVTKGMDLDNS